MKKNKTMIVVFLTPAVLLFLGIFLYPIIRTVIMSFFKIDGVTDSMDLWKFVGFGNYTKLMSTSLFKTSFFNLFRIWLIGGLVVMSLSLLFAVILTSGIRGKKFFRAIIYMPNIVSAVALATMWLQYVYSPRYGLLKDLFTGSCAYVQTNNSVPSIASFLLWELLDYSFLFFHSAARNNCDMTDFLIYKKYLTRNTAFAIIYHTD